MGGRSSDRSTKRPKLKYVTRAKAYARKVVNGKKVAGKYEILAAKRFLGDLERAKGKDAPFRFDERRANRVCRFIEYMPHTKGRWAQQRELVRLEDWQCFFLVNIYGFINPDGTRRFVEAYLRVARKNGKSIKAAAIGLYHLVEDGEFGAEVYSGATSRKQAMEVFVPAKRMVDTRQELREWYGVESNASNLAIPADGSKFEPIIGKPGDGASPSLAIIDEFHEHKTPELYDTMVTGMAAREQPLVLIITTAGVDIGGPCFEKDDDVKKILEGRFKDDSIFGLIYEADPDDAWDSKTALKKANPNLGVSVSMGYLERRLEAARRTPANMASYRTKHLNQWVGAGSTFLDLPAWDACAGVVDPAEMQGKDLVMGLDLSSRIDITASIKLWYEVDSEGLQRYWVKPTFFLPEAQLEADKTGRYAKWAEEGWITIHPDEEIDYAKLREFLAAEWDMYTPAEIAYDPWKSIGLEQELSNKGLLMVRVPQTIAQFTSPMDELQAAHKSRRLIHDNNPVMNWMAGNLIAKEDTNGNKKPRREIPKNKIDGQVAMLMAMNRAMARGATRYVTGGVRVI